MRQLSTRPLTPDRIGQAFPLIQATVPDVTLDDWRRFAMTLMTPREPRPAGIMTVLSELDYIAGLCIYRVEHDLRHGWALAADHFLALDPFNRGAVVLALVEALEALARENGCAAVHTSVPERCTTVQANGRGLIEILCSLGHEIETVRLCKRLEHTV